MTPSRRGDELESFDVFDTVLMRALGSPRSVFALLGKRLADLSWIAIAPDAFADSRIRAESAARRRADWREVSLDDIYHELCRSVPLAERERQRAMDLECEVEGELLRPVPGAVARVSAARNRHGRAIFVSDMYLPGTIIRKWLDDHGLWADGDRLYLSCESGQAKADGALFRLLLRQEGLDAAALLHHGNHPQSDSRVPARLGLRVRPFPEGNPNRYEDLMEAQAPATGGFASAFAGASRQARLLGEDAGPAASALRAVSAGVLAPAVTAFVVWLLLRARAAGLSRLYFLSRDGQILVDVARRIAPRLGVECELRYLYASRQSWHLPSLTHIGAAQLEWICMQYDFLSVRSLFRRVKVDPGDIAGALAGIGLREADWDRQLRNVERERIRSLLTEPPVRDAILAQAALARESLIGYLRQERVLDDGGWAVVDIGWNGRLQASLGELLAAAGRPAPRGYYFGLASRPAAVSAGTLEAYAFDATDDAPRALSPHNNLATLMEIACAADHGSVEEFACIDGRFAPVLRSPRNQPAFDWGLPILQETMRRFADALLLDPRWFDSSADLRPMSDSLLTAFWTSPTRAEVEVWGRFPFENDQSGAPAQPIARAYRADHIIRSLLGRRGGRRSVSSWPEGSIAMSPAAFRAAIRFGTRLRRILRGRIPGR